jgi:hypothetical protein
MNLSNSQFVGWTAIIGGIVGVIGFIALMLLFVVGKPFFGTLNDLLSIPTAILLMPLVFALYRLNATDYPLLSLLAALAGVAGFAAVAIGSALLIAGRIEFQQSLIPGMGGFGLIGVWVLLNSIMGLINRQLPSGAAWMGILLALTPTLALVALFRAGSVADAMASLGGLSTGAAQISPLAYAFVVLGLISYAAMPIWYVWVGRLFLSGRVGLTVVVVIAQT